MFIVLLSFTSHLASNKEVFAFHNSFLYLCLDSFPHLCLVAVHQGTVNVPVADINCILHCLCHFTRLGLCTMYTNIRKS